MNLLYTQNTQPLQSSSDYREHDRWENGKKLWEHFYEKKNNNLMIFVITSQASHHAAAVTWAFPSFFRGFSRTQRTRKRCCRFFIFRFLVVHHFERNLLALRWSLAPGRNPLSVLFLFWTLIKFLADEWVWNFLKCWYLENKMIKFPIKELPTWKILADIHKLCISNPLL